MSKSVSKWRNMFWPIYGAENKKFIPMAIMMALSLFNYTSLRITKDALIVTAVGSGASVLNFLKGYVVMPMSILFVVFYSAMSNRVSKKNLFYVTLLPFFTFFVLFGLVLYPLGEYIHLHPEKLLQLQDIYPRLKHVVPIFGYWSYSLFYVFSELWGSVVITLLFWQFANLNTTKDEVKRFYPLFGAYSNIGLVSAGLVQRYSVSTELTCLMVIISGAFLIGIYWWINKYVLIDAPVVADAPKKPKVKLSVGDSFKVIFQSKYLGYIAILTLAYGMTLNLVEVTWKDQVRSLYPIKSDFQAFMGNFYIATGIASFLIGFCMKNVVKRFGWLVAAMITPIVLLLTSVLFYGFTLYSHVLLPAAMLTGSLPVLLAVIIGSIQNIASKSSKYALFDPTTQMTYIPLDDNLRIKGKAAVDVIGGRMGKSLGGHVQSLAILLTAGSQMTIAPMLMAIMVAIILWWLYAVKKLNKEYHAKLTEQGHSK